MKKNVKSEKKNFHNNSLKAAKPLTDACAT